MVAKIKYSGGHFLCVKTAFALRILSHLKVRLNRYSWGAGKVGSEYSSWFCMQIGLKMEAGDCPTLNMNAKENHLLRMYCIDRPRVPESNVLCIFHSLYD